MPAPTLREQLEDADSADCVFLILLSRPGNANEISRVAVKAERVIENFSAGTWKCLHVMDIEAEIPDADVRALLGVDDAGVAATILRKGNGLDRVAKRYRIDEIDTALEILGELSRAGV